MHEPQLFMMSGNSEGAIDTADRLQAEFFKEYTSPEAIYKYTSPTAGYGTSYLLEHDYKEVYLQALGLLPRRRYRTRLRQRYLEFVDAWRSLCCHRYE